MNGIRLFDASASIDEDQLLQIGSDKFGQKQILIGVLPLTDGAGDTELFQISNENWGNRVVSVPPYYDPTSFGDGFWVPPIYPEIAVNSATIVKARHGAAAAAVQRCLLKYQIAASDGSFPASMAAHIGDLHTQFAEGTATNGSFPDRSSPTAQQSILNEMANEQWMPLMAAAIGDTPGIVKFAHPQDEGFPPFCTTSATIGLGLGTFQVIPPTNAMNGADDMEFLAQDDAAAAVDMWLYIGRIKNGVPPVSNRAPYGL